MKLKYKILIPLFVGSIFSSIVIFIFFNFAFKIYVVNFMHNTFLFATNTKTLNPSDYNIYLTNYIEEELIKSINLTLLLILSITTLIFILIAYFVAKSISNPITKLSHFAINISKSHYEPIELRNPSLEIDILNNSINKLVKKLQLYHNAQKTVFQNASHELRTPLMSIQGYAEGIKYGVFKDTNSSIDIIICESKRLSNLVTGLLTLSELNTFDFEVNIKQYNLVELLNSYVDIVNGISYKTNIKINVTCDDNLTLNTDKELLSQAVVNILSNCLRYAVSEINISSYSDSNSIVITIRDDGTGFSDDDIENMFTRFYKGKKGNVGLGMPIAKSSIEYLHGTLTARNSSNGAVFIIKIPK